MPTACRIRAWPDVVSVEPQTTEGVIEMVAIKLYDIETGHVETLARVTAESAQRWLDNFRAGTNDVVYLEPVDG